MNIKKCKESWHNFYFFLLGLIYYKLKTDNRINLILNSIEFDKD